MRYLKLNFEPIIQGEEPQIMCVVKHNGKNAVHVFEHIISLYENIDDEYLKSKGYKETSEKEFNEFHRLTEKRINEVLNPETV